MGLSQSRAYEEYSEEELYELFLQGGKDNLIWNFGNFDTKRVASWSRFEKRAAVERKQKQLDSSRRDFERSTCIPVAKLSKVMCNGLALMAGESDSRLSLCRGYIVFPKLELFMEHWWVEIKEKSIVFDPIVDILYSAQNYSRLLIDRSSTSEVYGVGSFDCNAMEGKCERKGEPCEWCTARASIEAKHPGYRPFELYASLKLELKPL